MGVRWTDRQKKVIDLHNRNLLVAAAAGSGKTAVLVERMIQMITRKEDPVDIDRLLVVTFTNAAAAEMRERIGAALEAALKEDPGNVHLQSQVTLLHNAQISTIHSFGLSVIRNHFYQIDLDPAFRIGDEREISMLKEDVLEKVLEEAYAEGTEAFLDFVRTYGNTKNDRNICEMILNFHSYADSYPWPKEWLADCLDMYQVRELAEFNRQPWVNELVAYVQALLKGLRSQICVAREIALESDGPQLYAEALEQDLALLDMLDGCQDYQEMYQRMQEVSFVALSRKKQICDLDKKELCQNIRNDVKKQLKKISDTYFSYSPAQQLFMLQDERETMEVLVDLTSRFMDAFAKAKDDKNILDFGDIEHLTLQILVDAKTKLPTATAREYQERFVEVLVDEYQDSNYVQEALLTAVSREHLGDHNMFMVGDVKQSIYRFRLARPELFMDKYRNYTAYDSENQKIDLHHNFRSRPEILDFTNDVFFHVMDQDMGNVIYDDEAALYVGREFPQPECATTYQPELMLIREEGALSTERVELEARVVATKIRQMTDEVTAGEYRPEYKDIVILVHAMKGWSDVFIRVFAEEGIPLISSSRSGYFAAIEVQTMIQLLKLLNNPRQDIPMAGVLKSVIVGLTDVELAVLKAAFPTLCFYEAVYRWRDLTGEDAAAIVKEKVADSEQLIRIHEKVKGFFLFLNNLRSQVPDTPIHELIQLIYEKTGYLDYVTALPGGERRRANLDMLVELAISYESTSYQGLFDFVRYIEKMIRFELDYGEAELVSEQENAVRMMTIHKSKGLEFPVVFVCGMGKEFNMLSLNNPLVFHPRYGAGIRWMGKEFRIKKNSLARQVFGLLEKRELLGEEQRLLYVALTRAKEKLVLTGFAKDQASYDGKLLAKGEKLDFSQRIDAKCFWDWVLPVVYRGNISCLLTEVDAEYVELGRKEQILSRTCQKAELLESLAEVDSAACEKVSEQLGWKYPYADKAGIKQKVSVSELKHRYMEQRYMEQQDMEEAAFLHKEPEVIPYLPRFAERVEEENAGALRGTAMHRYLECFDFAKIGQRQLVEEINRQLEQMSSSGRLSEDLRGRLNMKKLEGFLQTEEAHRMGQAAARGELYREKPFVMSVPASEVWPELKKSQETSGDVEIASFRQTGGDVEIESFQQTGGDVKIASFQQTDGDVGVKKVQKIDGGKVSEAIQKTSGDKVSEAIQKTSGDKVSEAIQEINRNQDSEETVLVQGIVDVFWLEEDGITLLDYKTDAVTTPEELVRRYKLQLELYAEALSRVFDNCPVKDVLIYSFRLETMISLSDWA